MSQSRKKVSSIDLSLLLQSQKTGEQLHRRDFKRKCCDKENQCSREGRQCRSKDDSKSLKKQLKKKYLQDEVQKMLQRRYENSETKIRQYKQNNHNQILGLRQDMKSMKDVIMKLSTEDKKPFIETKALDFESRCHFYQSKLDKIEGELQSQRSRNAMLEQTQTQSQLFAEQTKKFSETIKLQLEELSNKHLKCQETNRQLQKAYKKIRQFQEKQRQLDYQLASSKNNEQLLMEQTKRLTQLLQQTETLNTHIKEKSELLSEQNKNLKQQMEGIKQAQASSKIKAEQELQQIQSSYEQLLQDKELLQQEMAKKIEVLQQQLNSIAILKNQFQAKCEQSKKQLSSLESTLKKQSILKSKLEMEMKKMQSELDKTNIDLGNTKNKLDGLSSMEQKCEELYQQIKKQKSKWSQFSQQSCNQRKMYVQNLKQLQSANSQLQTKCSQMTRQFSQFERQTQKLRQDNYRLVQDKAKLARELKIIENSAKQAENLRSQQLHSNQNKLKCRQMEWKQQRQSLQARIKHLQSEVIGSLQIAKKKSDDIILNNQSMQRQITRLMHEKQILYERFNNIQEIVVKNEEQTTCLKESLSLKEKECRQQQIILAEWQVKYKTASETILAQNCQKTKIQSEIIEKKLQVESLTKENQEKQRKINILENQNTIQAEQIKQISSLMKEKSCSYDNIGSEMRVQAEKNNELSKIIKINEVVIETQQSKIRELQQKLENSEHLLQQSAQNLNRIQLNGRTIIVQLQKKYESIRIKLEVTENESKNLKLRYSEHQNLLQSQRAKRQQYESKVRSLESLSFSLTTQLQQLQSCTKRSEEQLQWYQSEINLKNKSIGQLKQTIKMVKNESILIMEEVTNYRSQFNQLRDLKQQESNKLLIEMKKFEQFEGLASRSIEYMKQRLDDLASDKVDIVIQLKRTQQKNEQLQQKIKYVYEQLEIKGQYQNKVQILTDRMTEMRLQEQAFKQNIINQRNQLLLDIQYKTKEISMLKSILQQERMAFTTKIAEIQQEASSNQANLESQTIISEKLTKIIEEKQQVIMRLTQKNASYEDKRIKIINEVHSIQNQISQLSERNNILQADNSELQQRIRESDEKIKIYEQKIAILLENKYAMEEQKNALQDQSKCLQQQIVQSKSRQKQIQEQSQRKLKELYTLSEQRKSETSKILNEKIQQLTHQISVFADRLKEKDVQMEQISKRQRSLQSILKQNHFLLAEEKKERERLVIVNQQMTNTIESSKVERTSKDRDYECLLREKTILKEKLIEIQARYESLAKKYESTEREKFAAQREIENQALTLRVLREENQSIERVMSEQLNQRKAIIEQLVNQKRMLYSQYHQH